MFYVYIYIRPTCTFCIFRYRVYYNFNAMNEFELAILAVLLKVACTVAIETTSLLLNILTN